jgi:carbon starvation protein CstA
MITWDEVERRRQTAELGVYSGHLTVVLSLVLSLAAVAIISKKHLVNSLWVDVAALAVSIPIALYFENRIVRLRLGIFPFVVAIVLALCAAVLFGI